MPDQDRTATREEMKEEALIRMDLLGLYKQTIQRFHQEGEIALTSQSYAGRGVLRTRLWTSHDIATFDQEIQRFEEEYNCVVYHAIQHWALTTWPHCLLFVSPAVREWTFERQCILRSGQPRQVCALVKGSRNDGIQDIGVRPQDGCLAWVR